MPQADFILFFFVPLSDMNIGMVCFPTYGGSGVVATELGKADELMSDCDMTSRALRNAMLRGLKS